MSPDVLSVVVRALSFVLFFQATGAAFFAALFKAQLTQSTTSIYQLGRWAASLGIVLLIVHLSLEAARMTGEFAGMLDVSVQRLAWGSSNAVMHGVQAAALLLIALVFTPQRRSGATLAAVGAIVAVSAFLLTGHTSVHPWRIVLAPLLAIHLLAVAFWFGSLIPLRIVTRSESLPAAANVLQRFSSLATWIVPLILVAGLAMALLLASGIPNLKAPYGLLLTAKLSGFVILMVFAALNKWRLVPVAEQGIAPSLGALRSSMMIEFLLIIGVLGATSVMTAFFSPVE